MKRTKELVVTKRDETVERFSLPKLVNSIRVALEGRGYDGRLSGPLARAVEMHLWELRRGEPPSTDYIFRCVSSVLQQTGLTDVCEDLMQHRRARLARRRRLRVAGAPDGQTAATAAWKKSMIVATLENRYGLRHGVARFLAGQVERQVFMLNYRVVTTALLAELTRCELLAWGLASEAQVAADAAALEVQVGGQSPKKEP